MGAEHIFTTFTIMKAWVLIAIAALVAVESFPHVDDIVDETSLIENLHVNPNLQPPPTAKAVVEGPPPPEIKGHEVDERHEDHEGAPTPKCKDKAFCEKACTADAPPHAPKAMVEAHCAKAQCKAGMCWLPSDDEGHDIKEEKKEEEKKQDKKGEKKEVKKEEKEEKKDDKKKEKKDAKKAEEAKKAEKKEEKKVEAVKKEEKKGEKKEEAEKKKEKKGEKKEEAEKKKVKAKAKKAAKKVAKKAKKIVKK